MKQQNDVSALPVSSDSDKRPQAVGGVAGTGAAITEDTPKKFKQLRGTARHQCPADALPEHQWAAIGFGRMLVPVSSVASQWGISPRRVRQMLEQGRLEGRQRDNGYWEVFYPFRYQFGTRGPKIKQQRDLPPLKTFPNGMSRREWEEFKQEQKF